MTLRALRSEVRACTDQLAELRTMIKDMSEGGDGDRPLKQAPVGKTSVTAGPEMAPATTLLRAQLPRTDRGTVDKSAQGTGVASTYSFDAQDGDFSAGRIRALVESTMVEAYVEAGMVNDSEALRLPGALQQRARIVTEDIDQAKQQLHDRFVREFWRLKTEIAEATIEPLYRQIYGSRKG
jgi:hypothetical protein